MYLFFPSNSLQKSIRLGAGTLNWIVSFSFTYFRKCCKAAVDPLSFLSTQLCVPIKPQALGEAALQPTTFVDPSPHSPQYEKESWIKRRNG